ncbi:hypothetical protein [Noviherbaspirillum massiliense]|uniref:hypothetical protein n=1 Tax=Noviherbaspirillum massiliense TaxID=1465823 RepID=UPI0002F8481E|nr:hypothetical protein [Noviherbaspirillum massiliense]
MSSGNRNRNEISSLHQHQNKKSGDQHIEPMDEPMEAPHRPHRVNREDMQKVESGSSPNPEGRQPD